MYKTRVVLLDKADSLNYPKTEYKLTTNLEIQKVRYYKNMILFVYFSLYYI